MSTNNFKVFPGGGSNFYTTSEWESTDDFKKGFSPQQVIYSKNVNTILRQSTMINVALLNSLSSSSSFSIGITSSLEDIQSYISEGLNEKISNSVNSLGFTIQRDSSNGDKLILNNSEENIVNSVHSVNSDNSLVADKLSSSAGDSTTLIYFLDGKPTVSSSNVGSETIPIYMKNGKMTASTATEGSDSTPVYMKNGRLIPCPSVAASKLSTPRKISLSGDVKGNTNFDGSSDITISASLTNPYEAFTGNGNLIAVRFFKNSSVIDTANYLPGSIIIFNYVENATNDERKIVEFSPFAVFGYDSTSPYFVPSSNGKSYVWLNGIDESYQYRLSLISYRNINQGNSWYLNKLERRSFGTYAWTDITSSSDSDLYYNAIGKIK